MTLAKRLALNSNSNPSTSAEPWDITRLQMTYSKNLNINYVRFNAAPINFSPDGLWAYRQSGDLLFYEQLSTAYDLVSKGVSAFQTNAVSLKSLAYDGGATNHSYYSRGSGFYWGESGYSLFVVNSYYSTGWNIGKFVATTPYDPTTLTWDSEVSPGLPSGSSATYFRNLGLTFSPDGLTVYVYNPYRAAEFWVYPLTTAWDLSTLGAPSYADVGSFVSSYRYPYSLEFDSTGTKIVIRDVLLDLATPWDVSSVTSSAAYAVDIALPNSGRGIITVTDESQSQYIENQIFILTDPWDAATTTTLEGAINYGMLPDNMYEKTWANETLSKIFIVRQSGNEYTKFIDDFAGPAEAESPGGFLSVNPNTSSFAWKPDGTKFVYFTGTDIAEVSLATPWDLSSSGVEIRSPVSHSYSRTWHDPNGIYIIAYWYDSSTSSRKLQLLKMSTPWDITTAAEVSGSEYTFTSSTTSSFRAVAASPDLSYLFLAENDDVIRRYPIPVFEDLSSITTFDMESENFYTDLTSYDINDAEGLHFSSDGYSVVLSDDNGADIVKLEII